MLKSCLKKLIRLYQLTISPLLGDNCRFVPSCSSYCCLAMEKYGVARGLWKGFKRVLRCNPWCSGGTDNP